MKSLDQVNKQIKFIAKAGAKLDAFIQETAEQVAAHFEVNKDNGLVNRLYLALPKGARKSAMTEWLLTFLAVEANMSPSTMKDQPFVYCREKETDVEGAKLIKWFDCKPDPKPSAVFDFQKFVKAALKKYGEAETTNMTPEQAHALAALAGVADSDVPTRPSKMKEEANVAV